MPLTPEQQADADKLGIPYDTYEALQGVTFDINAINAAVASLTAPGGINTPEGQAASIAGIAANIGNINPLTMLGLDLTVNNPIILTNKDGTQTIINQANPTQDLTSPGSIEKILKDVTKIEYLDPNTGRQISEPIDKPKDKPVDKGDFSPIKTISVKVINNSISKGTTNYTINGQKVEEGSTTQFDFNKLNDTTIIYPNYDTNKFTVLNRFVIGKNGDGFILSEIERGTPKEPKFFTKTPATIELDFKYEAVVATPKKDNPPPTNSGSETFTIKQSIGFLSNYSQSPFNIKVETGNLPQPLNLKINDIANISTTNTNLKDVVISVSNTGNYDLLALKWAYAGNDTYISTGFVDGKLTLPGNVLIKNINVFVELKPSDSKIAGIQLGSSFNFKVPGSTLRSKFKTTEFNIPVSIKNSESVLIKTPFGERRIALSSGVGFEGKTITLDVKKDFKNNVGSFKIVIVPTNTTFGDTPNPGYTTINVSETYDVPLINEINFPDSITIPTYTLGDYPFNIQYKSNTADYVLIYHTTENNKNLIGKYGKAETLTFNFNDLKKKGAVKNGAINLIFIPYDETNVNGQSVMEAIRGDETKIEIKVAEPALYVSTDKLKQDLYNSIIRNIDFNLEDRPRYLNHLAEFDKEDKQIVISNWDVDYSTFTNFQFDELGNRIPVDITKTIVLKLYEPLPTSINKNDTLWISEIMSLPIVRTVTITGESIQNVQFLRGPNFDIEVDFVKQQSTAFESLDQLILSGSTSSQQIVDKYLYDNLFEVDKVNIDYGDFNNFVKYSSAVERLANFKYKKELLEYYDDRVFHLQAFTGSISAVNEILSYQTKKVNLLNAFDGWENSLVSGSKVFYSTKSNWNNNKTYNINDVVFEPDTNNYYKCIISNTNYKPSVSTSNKWELVDGGYSYDSFPTGSRFTSGSFDSNGKYNVVYADDVYGTATYWFNSTLLNTQAFDTGNKNALKNNIPLFLVETDENSDYLLFLDMIGHHFDIIWSYIKGMTETKNITEKDTDGIHDDMLYNYLKSFGWDAKNLNSNKQLWSYLFGKDTDGNIVEENTPEKRTKTVWRRIANNLPYLLKHKGTKRGIQALLNCYGIANSNLSIIEFGGPDSEDAVETTKYTYDTQTANLNFTSGSYLTTRWSGSNAIELRIKPAYSGSGMTLVKGNSFTLSLVPGNHASQTSGSLELAVSSSTGLENIVTTQYQFYDGNYHNILLNKETIGTGSTFTLYYKTGEKDRIIKEGSFNYSFNNAVWNTGSTLQIGGTYVGEMDEFRMWNTPLSESAFDLHVLHPEAINGNHISASTTDLQVRLDFEYPKNLALTASVKNVAPSNIYQTYVSASGFTTLTQYPHQYEIVDRSVTLSIPNSGASRYSSNKVRFEDQTLISDLSYKSRSTKKAYETSKRDSNRLGLFFSPNKDLDLDIAKSFGGISIDDYIGAYDDQYQDTYKDLTDLRNYYFERIGSRDIYQFINLVRLYDKSLFVNLKQMIPARVKATTGLLIAPHLLERSKHKVHKPTAEDVGLADTSIDTTETTLISGDVNIYDAGLILTSSTLLVGEFGNYEASISLATSNILEAENDSYETTINTLDIDNLVLVDNYYETNQTASIDTRIISASITAEFEGFGSTIVNVGELYSDIGYSSYFDNGYARLNYQDYDGTYKSRKVRAFVVTRRKDLIIPMNVSGISGSIYEDILTDVFTNELILQEGNQTASLASDLNIISITTASGYLKSHYIYNKDRSIGLENTFFIGSKQTSATTIDGRAAVEEFVSNPTILRVNENGRPNNEPILVVD
jgi:hypothetical protein